MLDKEGYRPNVGIILANPRNDVFWGKRVHQHAWQFPQGGIKHGETPLEAMYRHARAARIYDGPDEVHRQSVARQILRGYEPREVPSEHVPTRRAEAQERFAGLLEAVTSND